MLEAFCDTKDPKALLCISRFAANDEIRDMILNNDKVLNTLLEILRDDDGTADPTIAALIMKTFASLAQKDDAEIACEVGVLEEVMDWIQQSGEEAEDGSVGRASTSRCHGVESETCQDDSQCESVRSVCGSYDRS